MARRKPKRLPHLLKETEPELLLRATARERDRLMLLTLLYAGLRVAELTALKVEDLDFTARTLFVRLGKGSRDRLVPLARCLVGPLRGWTGSRPGSAYVFPSRQGGGRMSERAVQLLFKRLAAKVRLSDRRCAHPHALRHAFAVRLLNGGANIREVQMLLGHSSLATTERYLNISGERLRGAIDRL